MVRLKEHLRSALYHDYLTDPEPHPIGMHDSLFKRSLGTEWGYALRLSVLSKFFVLFRIKKNAGILTQDDTQSQIFQKMLSRFEQARYKWRLIFSASQLNKNITIFLKFLFFVQKMWCVTWTFFENFCFSKKNQKK